jgi:hypothetical protein
MQVQKSRGNLHPTKNLRNSATTPEDVTQVTPIKHQGRGNTFENPW